MSGREWTKYDSRGAGYQPTEPYGDFSVALDGSNDPLVTNVTRYIGGGAAAGSVGGLGTVAQQTVSGGATTYKHGDLMGSAQLATDGPGAAGSSPATLACTAFGEHVTAGSGSAAKVGFPVTTGSIGATRYHYAGAHGYESGLLSLSGPNSTLAPITLQHVGARWYQPDIGRFVQRDPIGLRGGVNVYAYCASHPLAIVDPFGLDWHWASGGPWWADLAVNITGGVGDNVVIRFFEGTSAINADNVAIGAAVVGLTAAGAAGAMYCLGVDIGINVGVHSAHHFFPAIGREAAHFQINTWQVGVKGSGWVWRLPLW